MTSELLRMGHGINFKSTVPSKGTNPIPMDKHVDACKHLSRTL